MAWKYSFKLFLLKCIFEFMINTAPQGSNSVNGSSLRGRRLKGKGKGVLGAREMRKAREEGGRETQP